MLSFFDYSRILEDILDCLFGDDNSDLDDVDVVNNPSATKTLSACCATSYTNYGG
ncbi:hypothetical protein GF312_20920 [Candidatus Poribacteria bacterium]|nr:hypothetical protein [Candidatus Poribacteria bacterium]